MLCTKWRDISSSRTVKEATIELQLPQDLQEVGESDLYQSEVLQWSPNYPPNSLV